MQAAFALAWLGAPFDQTVIDHATEAIIDQVQEEGLASWIETVRKHHSHTYQHSLLVTGLAVGFGLQLGFSRADTKRLSFAGIMHDIGKARVPVSILEKPGPLDEKEMDVIRQHPMFGWEALQTFPEFPPRSWMPCCTTTNIWMARAIRTGSRQRKYPTLSEF